MSDIAIRVEGLSKRYQIGATPVSYRTLRESVTDMMAGPFRRLSRAVRPRAGAAGGTTVFWALKDVSFTVPRGAAVGIIGRNGAGKSTLLKILSRITDPTAGFAEIHGRVGSLLEVGTGFHPELTGRENIYLNGAILGMRRTEIARKFAEIVAFSEVEQFIDSPIKHYSSGMYLRLAFAVAAHLDPEILLVDEVLAVGDAAFRKKCLGKMDAVAHTGRTVFLVSHDLTAIQELCPLTLLLESGQVMAYGPTVDVINQYMGKYHDIGSQYIPAGSTGTSGQFHLLSVRVHNAKGISEVLYSWDEDIYVRIDYRLTAPFHNLRVGFQLEDERGVVIFRTGDADWVEHLSESRAAGTYQSTCVIPRQLLNRGHYFVSMRVDFRNVDWIYRSDSVINFDVGQIPLAGGHYNAQIRPHLQWQHCSDPP
ncbi:MAG: ABC transporter ATP-binding protein [Chloroflexota bacterium]|nr:ABC transporter ATP-binding protein [Chloroflexota bacterium]